MKRKILTSAVLAAFILNVSAQYAENNDNIPFVNDYDCYVSITKEMDVVDELAIAPKIIELEDSIRSVESQTKCEDLVRELNLTENNINIINYFLDLDGKIKDKEDKILLDSLVQSTLQTYKYESSEKIAKDARKGKLSEPVIIYLSLLNKRLNVRLRTLKNEIEDRKHTLQYIHNDLLEELAMLKNLSGKEIPKEEDSNYYTYSQYDLKSIPTKHIIGEKSIKNPWRRKLNEPYTSNMQIDIKRQVEGWEWIEREEYSTETIYYPINISYRIYSGHPDLHIIGDYIFDKDGNLMRVNRISNESEPGESLFKSFNIFFEVFNLYLIKQDYKANKYNIRNEGKDVIYALDNLLGESDAFKKQEETRLKPYLTELENALNSGNIQKYNQLRNKYATIIYAPTPNDPKRNEKAANFINQCKQDHEKDKLRVWEVERIDDKTFNIVLINNANTETRAMTVAFKTNKPYEVTFDILKGDNGTEYGNPQPFDSSKYEVVCDTENEIENRYKEWIRPKKHSLREK